MLAIIVAITPNEYFSTMIDQGRYYNSYYKIGVSFSTIERYVSERVSLSLRVSALSFYSRILLFIIYIARQHDSFGVSYLRNFSTRLAYTMYIWDFSDMIRVYLIRVPSYLANWSFWMLYIHNVCIYNTIRIPGWNELYILQKPLCICSSVIISQIAIVIQYGTCYYWYFVIIKL